MTKLAVLSSAVLAASIASFALAAGSDPAPAEAWRADYDAAVALIKAEKYDAAITKLKAIDAKDSADVNNQLGYAYRQSGKWDEAVKFYEAALKIDPAHTGALEYYGEYFVWKGDLAKARTHLARIEKACGGKSCSEYKDLSAAIAKKATN